ncbi:MAG: TrkA C-terminal domain-containing protein [Acutalibacteraceae bacterium]
MARASSEQHRKVLTKVGADMVVFPEKDMGRKLAYTLAKTDVFEFINFSKDHSIVELKTPRRWAGKAIKDLDVRKRYGVNIIAISKAGSSDDFEIFTDPDRVLAPEETLVIIGGNEEIEKITGK